jgi:hypothetical protein
MARPMIFALLGAAVVLGLLGLVWTQQRRLMYFPYPDVPPPESLGVREVELVRFTTADGLVLHGWFFPSLHTPARFTMLVFNGNAGNRAYRVALAQALRRQGLAVLLFDYRGYGENPGHPTEAGLFDDGRAALAYLQTRSDVDDRRVVLFGESLGTVVAARLAVERPPAALVLRSPFVSMVELGRLHYPFLPVRWLLRDRFATIDDVRRLRSPLLVIAGDRDRIVPVSQSREVFAAAPPAKQILVVRGADHNDSGLLAGREMIDAIVRFLDSLHRD